MMYLQVGEKPSRAPWPSMSECRAPYQNSDWHKWGLKVPTIPRHEAAGLGFEASLETGGLQGGAPAVLSDAWRVNGILIAALVISVQRIGVGLQKVQSAHTGVSYRKAREEMTQWFIARAIQR